jgi:hypothetical protein
VTKEISMRRLPLTFALTVLTALALATGAIAAPEGSATTDCPMADDPAMTAMHADPDAMLAMHARMMAMHPQMAGHLADVGLEPRRMREWMAEGLGHEEMHRRLQEAGVDLEAMHADCPMVGTGQGSAGPTGGHAPHHGTARPHDGGPHHGESPSGRAPGPGMAGAHERHHR